MEQQDYGDQIKFFETRIFIINKSSKNLQDTPVRSGKTRQLLPWFVEYGLKAARRTRKLSKQSVHD